jgi:alpha-beta hydrolase superfamily lysophospholipase
MRVDLRLPAGVELPSEPALEVAASVWLPAEPQSAPAALLCLAGGNMNRGYYALDAAGDDSFSFAAQMTARGFIVIALDHLGLGDSTRPVDGYALVPELIASANAHATAALLARLREGTLHAEVPALPGLRSIGVGHSMGAMLTVLQQAQTGEHAGVALLGFSTKGLPQYLPADMRELAADPVAVRARLVEFARRVFVVPYPRIRSSGNGAEVYGSAKADPRGIAALKAATDCLLPVPAFLSMIPGNVAPEAARVSVPVFLGLGERDMAGPPHEIPAAFPGSRDVSLLVLSETGHSHFLFASRSVLFDRFAYWARGLASR